MTLWRFRGTRLGLRLGVPAILATLICGCATFSPDAGMQVVGDITSVELRETAIKIDSEDVAADARERTVRLLRSTLSPETAIQLALLNNKGLQAAYNELGISEAQFVAASLPPSPKVSITHVSSASFTDFEVMAVADLIALLTLDIRKDIAEGQFRQAQLQTAEATLRLAFETRRAFYRAVSDANIIAFLEKARLSAEAASTLAKQLGQTGALSKLDQAREHAFYYDLVAQLARARLREKSDRERLTRLMGLWGTDIRYQLPPALPSLPAHPKVRAAIEIEALERRVDLQIAGIDLETLAKRLGLTEATRFVSILDLGGAHRYERTSTEKLRASGLQTDVQIPIFDLGETRLREVQQTYMQAVNRLAERAVNVRSEAREAYQAYRGSYDIARNYQTQVLPLREIIVDETQLRVNGMLVDVFQLLADARARVDSNIAAIEAKRDFFIAATDLSASVVGGIEARASGDLSSAQPASSAAATVKQ